MNVAIVFAGGVGTRMGSEVPKQFLELNGKPVLAHTLGLFEKHARIDKIILVVAPRYFDDCRALLAKYGISKLHRLVGGMLSVRSTGASRSTRLSVARKFGLSRNSVSQIKTRIEKRIVAAGREMIAKEGHR